MTTPSPTEYYDAITKVTQNSERLDTFVNGTAVETVVTDNGTLPTLAKVVEDFGDTAANAAAAVAAAAAASASEDKSQAWAEGTLPGGAGTKSAKEHAEDAAAAVSSLVETYTDTVGNFPLGTPALAYSAGDLVFLDPCSLDGAELSITVDPRVTGSVKFKRLTVSSGTYTQQAAVSKTFTTADTVTYTAADLAALEPWASGDILGFWHDGCVGRNTGTPVGLGVRYSGSTSDQTSFTAATDPGANVFAINATWSKAVQIVTKDAFVQVQDDTATAAAAIALLKDTEVTTIGPDPITNPTITYAAGDLVLLDPCPTPGATITLTIDPRATGTIKVKRLSKSGATYTQEAAVSFTVSSTDPITYSEADLAALGTFAEGEFVGLWTNSGPIGRVSGTQPGLGIAYSGSTADQTSFSATTVAAGNQFNFNVTFTGERQTVTSERFLAVEDAVGLGANRPLLIFGDSLSTAGQGFADELTALFPFRTVAGQGVGGQQAGSVAIRTGGAEANATVTGASIPASGSGVVITAISPDPFAASIGTNASFIASLHDVPGVLSKAGATYTFTRSDTGGAISLTNPAKLRIRSTFAANTTASGVTMLSSLSNAVGVLRNGHNDIFNDVIRDFATYSRQAVKDYIAAQVEALGGPNNVVVCSITRGYSWLTAARVSALGLSGTITGNATDDAETVEAINEANALNQWMSDTFPGYVDLMAAYEASSASYISSIDFGSGNVFKFGNETLLPDGTHGTAGGAEQTIAAATIAAKITAMGI